MWHFFGCWRLSLSRWTAAFHTNTRAHTHTHMRAHAHTHSWDAGVLDMAQHFSRWPGCYAISHHSNMLSFFLFLSVFLSPSLVLREGKWQTRFFRKGWGCIFFYLCGSVLSECVCVIFVCADQEKNPGRFLMSGVLGRRRERGWWGGFRDFSLGFLLLGWWIIGLNWNSQRYMAETQLQVELKEAAESRRGHRWVCAD